MTRQSPLLTRAIVRILCLALLLIAGAAVGQTITEIAGSGEIAPGGGTFSVGLSEAYINPSGVVTFSAFRLGGHPASPYGLFRWAGGVIETIVQDGDPVVGGGRLEDTAGSGSFAIDASGNVAFLAANTLSPGRLNLYLTRNGVHTVAAVGGSAPGGGAFQEIQSFSLADSGVVTFSANINGGVGQGIFFGQGGALNAVAYAGSSNGQGDVFQSFDALTTPAMNDSGQIVFEGQAASDGVYIQTGSSLETLTYATSIFYQNLMINNAGQVSFDSGSGSIYLGTSAGATAVVTPSTTANDGNTFTIPDNPAINDFGDIAFSAFEEAGAGLFFWSSATGVIKVFVKGDAAPGGGVFTDGPSDLLTNSFAIDNLGEIAFVAPTSAGNSVYFWNGSTIARIAGTGDQPFGPKGAAITNVRINRSGSTPSQRALNDAGQIVYTANFEDGKAAIFRFTPAPVTPILTTPSSASGVLGQSFDLQITAYHVPTKFTAKGLPGGLTLNPYTGVISGIPKNSGVYSITFTASNSAGTAQASLSLTIADLSPNRGTYRGLAQPASYSVPSSGIVNLTVTSAASFTAALQIGGRSYSLHGYFDGSGAYSGTVPLTEPPLTLTLQLGTVGSPSPITGALSSASVSSQIDCELNPFVAETNPCPQAGKYTFQLQAPAPGADATPLGSGYAVASVAASGAVVCTGALADGSKFSQGGFVNGSAGWPFYFALYGGAGLLTGSLTFEELVNASDADGSFLWVAPTAKAGPGFAATTSVIGSLYTRPSSGIRALAFLNVIGNGQLTASDGGLTGAFQTIVTLNQSDVASPLVAGTDKLAFAIAPSTGTITGSFVPPGFTHPVALNGVVFQKQNSGFGYFLNAGESGPFTVAPNPAFGGGSVGGGVNGDKTPPTVIIKTPAANAKITGLNLITFSGLASDRAGIQEIDYQVLEQGQISQLSTATGTTSWSFSVTPAAAGSLTVYVKAVDADGNQSVPLPRAVTISQ